MPPLSLYIHWPWCLAKCPYCDFNSHARPTAEEGWRKAILAGMAHGAERLGPREIATVFFGGGTPSLMKPRSVAVLLNEAQKLWRFAEDAEITLEANPTSAEAGRFKAFRDAGVNRLSLGVQALDDEALAFLGRAHGADEARRAVADASGIFPRFSFDLIYARKGQTLAAWERELRDALRMADGHVSLYQLTLEPGTAFAARAEKGEAFQADENTQAGMYGLTQDIMRAAGLPAYEISNHARPGAACRHNLVYWHYGEYLGLGPGAHGRIRLPGSPAPRHAQQNIRAPEAWQKAVTEKGNGMESLLPLAPREAMTEALLMGLRLCAGIEKPRWQNLFASRLDDFLNPRTKAALIAEGLAGEDDSRFYVTPAGRLKLNAIIAELV